MSTGTTRPTRSGSGSSSGPTPTTSRRAEASRGSRELRSHGEQNIVILIYATPDGERYYRKERALTSVRDVRDTTAAVDVDPNDLGAVEPGNRERYAAEAQRMADGHDPDDEI